MKLGILRGIPALAVAVTCSILNVGHAAETEAPITGSAENARDKVSMCIGCHGIPNYKASFPEVYLVPKIAGQNAAYIAAALRAYASGDRSHPTMDAIAFSLSEQDIADLAAYYSSLK